MAGKGDKWREDFDFKKFHTNMDEISGEKIQPVIKKVVKKKNKTTYTYGD